MPFLKPKTLFIVIPVLLLLISGALFIVTAKPFFGIDLGINPVKRERTAVSVSVLTEVRDIMSLNTVEFVYKSVFPHDFLPSDIRWDSILYKDQTGQPLLPEEAEYVSIYRLCRKIGIDLRQNNYDFVVVTGIIKAGYDFSDTPYSSAGGTSIDESNPEYKRLKEYVSFSEDGSRLLLKLPQPEIVSFIIEDSTSEDYAYPDISIDPEQWKVLSTFVTEKVRGRVLEEGILRLARKKGEAFITRIMRDAGFQEVVFIE